ncbi:hypothetical protein C8J57DRAFT_1620567 [Mycena rebaudengoi]|nr:hypothetical protein C8J57DRAFT_1620567 [Mycena rebaudengoi]
MTAHADIQTTNRSARNKERSRAKKNAHIQRVVPQLPNIYEGVHLHRRGGGPVGAVCQLTPRGRRKGGRGCLILARCGTNTLVATHHRRQYHPTPPAVGHAPHRIKPRAPFLTPNIYSLAAFNTISRWLAACGVLAGVDDVGTTGHTRQKAVCSPSPATKKARSAGGGARGTDGKRGDVPARGMVGESEVGCGESAVGGGARGYEEREVHVQRAQLGGFILRGG